MVAILSCYLFISPDRLLATNAVPLVITDPTGLPQSDTTSRTSKFPKGAPEPGLGQTTGTQNQGNADEELHV